MRSRDLLPPFPATPAPTMRTVSATPPDDSDRPSDEEAISASAERARAELHAEIERVRRGVEQMLDEQNAPLNSDIRRELDTVQEDLRRYVKTRIRKSQKRTDRRVNRLEDRTDVLEKRLDSIDAERRLAEWRIHSDTERMLDGLLRRGPRDRGPAGRKAPSFGFLGFQGASGARRTKQHKDAGSLNSSAIQATEDAVMRRSAAARSALVTRSRCSGRPGPSTGRSSGSCWSRRRRGRGCGSPPRSAPSRFSSSL